MFRTYKSKKETGGGLDPRDVIQSIDEKSSLFDAFYIQNIKQVKRDFSCMGTSNSSYNKTRKKKYVKRLKEPLVEESISQSTFLTPDKSLRVNRERDPFDQLLNSSFSNTTPICKYVKKITSRSKRKNKVKKKVLHVSSDNCDSNKENEDTNCDNYLDIRSHTLFVEKDRYDPVTTNDSVEHIEPNFIKNLRSVGKQIGFESPDTNLKKIQNSEFSESPLCSTPVLEKYRGKSIYKFSPICLERRSSKLREIKKYSVSRSSKQSEYFECMGKSKYSLEACNEEKILVCENNTNEPNDTARCLHNSVSVSNDFNHSALLDFEQATQADQKSNSYTLETSYRIKSPKSVESENNTKHNNANEEELESVKFSQDVSQNSHSDISINKSDLESEMECSLTYTDEDESQKPFLGFSRLDKSNANHNSPLNSISDSITYTNEDEPIEPLEFSRPDNSNDCHKGLLDNNSDLITYTNEDEQDEPFIGFSRQYNSNDSHDSLMDNISECSSKNQSNSSNNSYYDTCSESRHSNNGESHSQGSSNSNEKSFCDMNDCSEMCYLSLVANSSLSSDNYEVKNDKDLLENSPETNVDELTFVNTRRRFKANSSINTSLLECSINSTHSVDKTLNNSEGHLTSCEQEKDLLCTTVYTGDQINSTLCNPNKTTVDDNHLTKSCEINDNREQVHSESINKVEAVINNLSPRKLKHAQNSDSSSVTVRRGSRISNSRNTMVDLNTSDIKNPIVLQPGKKWERSLSIYRRMTTMVDGTNQSILDIEPLEHKGRNYRLSVKSTIEMQEINASFNNESIKNHRPSFVSKPFRPSIQLLRESSASRLSICSSAILEDLEGFLSEDCDDTIIELSKLSIGDSEHETTIREHFHDSSGRLCTARDYVLRRCNQTDAILFDECYPDTALKNCRKIGEGVYGEVYLWRAADGRARVLKVIPIAGDTKVNGEAQKDYDQIISEIVIAMELSALRAPIQDIENHFNEGKSFENLDLHSIDNATDVFNEVLAVRLVYGAYPSRLLDLWELYDECKGSENDNPAVLPARQHYLVLELANAGQDLESYQFNNAEQAYALFKQVAFGLAIAEEACQFEHRDLHWGNVLIAPTDNQFATFVLRGRTYRVRTCGVKATIIDYSLSRATLGLADDVRSSGTLFTNLGDDESLFDAVGDYQFDVYRLMRDRLGNVWHNFEPYTNILWLHYTADKMITSLRYTRTNTKIHKHYIAKLKQVKNKILEYGSCTQYVLTDSDI
ncbi:uncharacterized protein LOC126975040 isoform X1 [Leptidea sinapis]|uniref:uncharacterized protein LOC126975040 isoform X1 n=1 Tax=Leptidea sinapis TaxID=189913 RepID=UPI0021296B9B|nr:uncharacterized protein LOC126975040 isoform X1 [Leptidea sinapis]